VYSLQRSRLYTYVLIDETLKRIPTQSTVLVQSIDAQEVHYKLAAHNVFRATSLVFVVVIVAVAVVVAALLNYAESPIYPTATTTATTKTPTTTASLQRQATERCLSSELEAILAPRIVNLRLHELLPCVHDKRTLEGDGLLDGLPRKDEQLCAVR